MTQTGSVASSSPAVAAGSQRSPAVTGRLYPTRPSSRRRPAAGRPSAAGAAGTPARPRAAAPATPRSSGAAAAAAATGARRPPGWRPARAPTGITAVRPAASASRLTAALPVRAASHRLLAAVCCNGLMQFNTYTVAGAQIAVWLVNHPAPEAAALTAELRSHDVHEPAGDRRPTPWRCGPGRSGCARSSRPAPSRRRPDSPTRCSSPPTAARGWSATARVSLSTSTTRRSRPAWRRGCGR